MKHRRDILPVSVKEPAFPLTKILFLEVVHMLKHAAGIDVTAFFLFLLLILPACSGGWISETESVPDAAAPASEPDSRRRGTESESKTGPESEPATAKERMENVKKAAESLLSPYEDRVFGLLCSGRSLKEIAALTGRSSRSVGNAVSRIRAKLASFL